MPRGPSRALALVLAGLLAMPLPAHAHNEPVHQRMTDYAYHVLLAGEARSRRRRCRNACAPSAAPREGAPRHDRVLRRAPGRACDSCARCSRACRSTRRPASRRPRRPVRRPGARLATAIGHDDHRIAADANSCACPSPSTTATAAGLRHRRGLAPSGELASVNRRAGSPARSHGHDARLLVGRARQGGEGLGAALDHARSPCRHPAVVGGIGASTSGRRQRRLRARVRAVSDRVRRSVRFVAVGAGAIVIDEIASIDADSLESEDYVGFGHFVDMKADARGAGALRRRSRGSSWSAPGRPACRTAPRMLVMALFHIGGMHVNHDESSAPKNYRRSCKAPDGGRGRGDFHHNSIDRARERVGDAEAPRSAAHRRRQSRHVRLRESKARKATPLEAKRLGWPLHAIGDAAVPMHAVGASGYGHRPYEDAVDMVLQQPGRISGSTPASLCDHDRSAAARVKWREVHPGLARGCTAARPKCRCAISSPPSRRHARQKASARRPCSKPDRSLVHRRRRRRHGRVRQPDDGRDSAGSADRGHRRGNGLPAVGDGGRSHDARAWSPMAVIVRRTLATVLARRRRHRRSPCVAASRAPTAPRGQAPTRAWRRRARETATPS